MWLNEQQISDPAVSAYRQSLLSSCPNHVVIDGLFDQVKLNQVISALQQDHAWQTQKHTYSALYVDETQWQQASKEERFVQRDLWSPDKINLTDNTAKAFLLYLRSDEFMGYLSTIFKVPLTDKNVAQPSINTNYFRLGSKDFVELHADDSPGRVVCMLLYLNKAWPTDSGGELVFKAKQDKGVRIAPLYNRCLLFDPSSEGSEHWVEKLSADNTHNYRYNVTSWYWSE
jgi:Rps23 Pro-64 3,4-dihydroxylase Tpa1-like proline 4-hydroxylase